MVASRCAQMNPEDSPIAPAHRVTDSPGLVALTAYPQLLSDSFRPMFKTKPQSSRAISAVTVL